MVVLNILTIILLYSIFGILHSYTAGKKFKEKIAALYPGFMPYYRLVYNITAIVSFYFVYNWSPLIDIKLYDLAYPFDQIMLVPQILALIAILWTLRYFDGQEFLGISQALRGLYGEYDSSSLDELSTFNVKGPYKYSRHPIYFFTIVFLLARPYMFLDYCVNILCIIAYFYTGSFFEERKMIEKFGEKYIEYARRVPRIIPFVKF